MRSYKFKSIKDAKEYKVRFYATKGVTVVDSNGEHEVGTWDKPDDDCWMYRVFIFDAGYTEKDWKQIDVAHRVLAWFVRKHRN